MCFFDFYRFSPKMIKPKSQTQHPLLKPWIDLNKIHWDTLVLNSNPKAMHLIEENLDKIQDWEWLSRNFNALSILEKHPDKVDWNSLCYNKNPQALALLEKYCPREKWDWDALSNNPNAAALYLLKKHPEKINWCKLSGNPGAAAISLLEENPDKINWSLLCFNQNAIPLLEKNLDKVVWEHLIYNPNATPLLEKHLEKLTETERKVFNSHHGFRHTCSQNNTGWNWVVLSQNPDAIHLLEQNQDKINWANLSANPNIFLTYEEMREQNTAFRNELLEVALHPTRIQKMLELTPPGTSLEDII